MRPQDLSESEWRAFDQLVETRLSGSSPDKENATVPAALTSSGVRKLVDRFFELAPEQADSDRDRDGEMLAQKYRIIREIGAGSMGIVYEAEDTFLERRIALKLIQTDTLPRLGRDWIRRFITEIQTLSKLEHPGIVRIYDGGFYNDAASEEEMPYFTMELVDGAETIDVYCRGRGLTATETVELFVKVCRAVEFAHRAEKVHCDLKHDNIIVDKEGNPKVLDFGLARARDEFIQREHEQFRIGPGIYIPPEQLDRATVRAQVQADIYSLGVALYWSLSESQPLELNDKDWEASKVTIRKTPPKALPLAAVSGVAHPERLQEAIRCALAKTPEERHKSAAHFGEALRQCLAPSGDAGAGMHRKFTFLSARVAVLVGIGMSLFLIVVTNQIEGQNADLAKGVSIGAKLSWASATATMLTIAALGLVMGAMKRYGSWRFVPLGLAILMLILFVYDGYAKIDLIFR